MNLKVRSYLYDNPRLYDLVFPDEEETVARMCLAGFEKYLGRRPESVLDIGCGTGLHLAALARVIPDAHGVDYLSSMIDYGRSARPHLKMEVGDMRSFRLGRTFEAAVCLGNAFSYLLTDEDMDRGLDTISIHAAPGGGLVMDLLNANWYLGADLSNPLEMIVDRPGFKARAVSRLEVVPERRLLVRRRTWEIPGARVEDDYCEYRLHDADEIRSLLSRHGFAATGIFDNREFRETDLSGRANVRRPDHSDMSGRKLYVFGVRT